MFYGWWIVIGILVNLSFFGPIAVALANLFQRPVTEEFGITNSAFAINNMLVLGVGVFIAPTVSKLLSGEHFKKVFLAGIALFFIGLLGYSVSQNIYMFYFFSILLGIGHVASAIIPSSILINNWFIEKRGLALSIALSGLGVGGFILSPIVTTLIATFNWRMTYIIYVAVAALITVPISLFVIKFKPEDIGLKALGYKEVDLSEDHEVVIEHKVGLSVKESMTKPFFIALLLGSFVIGLTNNGGLGQFPPSLAIQHSAAFSSIIVSTYSLVGVAGKLILGHVTDKYGVKVSILYTSLGMTMTFVLMMFSGVQLNVYLAAVLFGLSNANATVLSPLMTSSLFPANEYSGAYGYVQSMQMLGMAIGSLVVATISDVSGSYTTAWVAMAILCVFSGMAWLFSSINSKKYVTK